MFYLVQIVQTKSMKKQILFLGIFLLITSTLKAESSALDFLRSTGKIYSVIAVICVILIGIALFLVRIDKKLTKLENQINNEQ
ncbi:MAG: CcmD family protein [Saprospiraceae bacterium]